jgi:cytochrome c oxidase assembly protein subunit 15
MNGAVPGTRATVWYARLAVLAVTLALVVIVFGAFVRLSNAGLSCPDWPTCYGRAAWPVHAPDVAAANDAFPERPVEMHKAWREQTHRHLAATLGLLVLALAVLRNWHSRARVFAIAGAVVCVGIAIPLYMRGAHGAATALAVIGEAALLALACLRQTDALARVAVFTLAVVIFQALLGMWTVTWLLKPIVVMAHLLGGLATFALLLWAALRARGIAYRGGGAPSRALIFIALAALVLQIGLGGWTSANYAALACGVDFPTCLGQWAPAADFREAFVLWRGVGVDYEGGVLDGAARVAIQLTHRAGAIVAFMALALLAFRAWRSAGWRRWSIALVVALLAQISLGIANVHEGLPLSIATAHNFGAVLLLALVVAMLARRTPPMGA